MLPALKDGASQLVVADTGHFDPGPGPVGGAFLLLPRYRGHLVEVGQRPRPFPPHQQRRGLQVGDAFVPLAPGSGAGIQREAIHLRDAAEGAGQSGCLFRRGIEAVLIRPLHHLRRASHASSAVRIVGSVRIVTAQHAAGREQRFLPGLKAGVSMPQS